MPRQTSTMRAFLLTAVLAVTAGGGAAAQCPLPERESREAVSSGQVQRLPDVVRSAGLSMSDVVSAELCANGGRFVYRVKVLAPGGRLRVMELPAG